MQALDLSNTAPTTEEPPKTLIWTGSHIRPPILRYGFPLEEKFVAALTASEGLFENETPDIIELLEAGTAVIGVRVGLDLRRQSVLNEGYRDGIVELGNNIDPKRVSSGVIMKVKAILGTDKEPMWFLDHLEYRWKVAS